MEVIFWSLPIIMPENDDGTQIIQLLYGALRAVLNQNWTGN